MTVTEGGAYCASTNHQIGELALPKLETLKMAGLRGIVAGLAIGSAIMSLPAGAQSRGTASLTHTVSVTVPPRVKVQVSNLAFSSSAAPVSFSSQPNAAGLSVTVDANRAWVLSIGSTSGASAPKSQLQWSADGSSVFFRNAASTHARGRTGEMVVLTVSAP